MQVVKTPDIKSNQVLLQTSCCAMSNTAFFHAGQLFPI